MCGRYALALRPSQVRRMLQDDDMPVDEAPDDDGDGSPRQSYNFAPGYHGIVYRADVPDQGAGQRREHGNSSSGKSKGRKSSNNKTTIQEPQGDGDASSDETETAHYKLQSMKWGLVPFWTKRNPDYASVLKTINCRDDSLAQPGGMWASMKARKRCIVVAQGFYEWLKPAGGRDKDKVPYFVKRADGKLMCFSGLWDCVQYDDEKWDSGRKHYTYTIITTDSNKQLRFLHDRMPVILDPGSEALRMWLDPRRSEWSKELQGLLRPYAGELEVYAVSREVGKVGNNSPNFVVPVASRENKRNIANFFAAAAAAAGGGGGGGEKAKAEEKVKPEVEMEVKREEKEKEGTKITREMASVEELERTADVGGMGSPPPETASTPKRGIKREASSSPMGKDELPAKKSAVSKSSVRSPSPVKKETQQGKGKISATTNVGKSPAKNKGKANAGGGSQKITKFFGNSA
ncbi:hypothetical protein B0T17DRAFT_582897 [Bombardia bombarda]|uniref:Embryonic stem cell-specific 5-hydroxymethylcytosine-binding protein n=1 Tax=Bombardia bombarda TaxID=252184 RepID=A0AA39WGQ2_9PEZI|nr:hypothetical protein B0T17DRAFT_582897 [Bombardia bombarda]